MLGNFLGFWFCLLTFFKNDLLKKYLSETLSECQTVRPDLGPNCLQRLSADKKVSASKERVKYQQDFTIFPILMHLQKQQDV